MLFQLQKQNKAKLSNVCPITTCSLGWLKEEYIFIKTFFPLSESKLDSVSVAF